MYLQRFTTDSSPAAVTVLTGLYVTSPSDSTNALWRRVLRPEVTDPWPGHYPYYLCDQSHLADAKSLMRFASLVNLPTITTNICCVMWHPVLILNNKQTLVSFCFYDWQCSRSGTMAAIVQLVMTNSWIVDKKNRCRNSFKAPESWSFLLCHSKTKPTMWQYLWSWLQNGSSTSLCERFKESIVKLPCIKLPTVLEMARPVTNQLECSMKRCT